MVIKRLKNKFKYGLDGIPNSLLKNSSDVLSKPLTLLINQTLTSGVFPEKLKSSKVIPILKVVKFHVSQTIDQFLYFLHCPKFLSMLSWIN